MAFCTLTFFMLIVSVAPAGAHSCENGNSPCSCAKTGNGTSEPCCEVVLSGDVEPATTLATECESLRVSLQTKWLGHPGKSWRPRCLVVFHADRERYLAAVGRGGLMTYGYSRITFAGDQIVGRRIDLCDEDRNRARSALAHEMSHVILADRFGRGSLPRWADEGVAVLADSREKQVRHHRDLADAIRQGRDLPFGYLAGLETPPSADRVAVFYGQSASLARFLAHRKTPHDFLSFVAISQRAGYDQAAKEVYGFADARSMEQAWRSDVEQQATALSNAAKPSFIPVNVDSNALAARQTHTQ